MNIASLITDAAIQAIQALYGAAVTAQQVQVQKTRPEFEGHLTLVTFPFLRISRKKPEDTGRDIAEWLMQHTDLIASYNVVKGFLNLTIAPAKWTELLAEIDADERYGLTAPTAESPLVMI